MSDSVSLLADLKLLLTEYGYSEFVPAWKQARLAQGESFQPEYATDFDLNTDVKTQLDRRNALVEHSKVLLVAEASSVLLGIVNALKVIANKPKVQIPSKTSWTQMIRDIVTEELAKPSHSNFLNNALQVYDPARLQTLLNTPTNVVSLDGAGLVGNGVAVWQKGVKFKLDATPVVSSAIATLDSALEGFRSVVGTSGTISTNAKTALTNTLNWFQQSKQELHNDTALLTTWASGLNSITQALQVPQGVEAKFILPHPCFGEDDLINSLVTSLSKLSADAPLFRKQSNVDSGAFVLLLFSDDLVGSLLLWTTSLLGIMGFNHVKLDQILEMAKIPALTFLGQQLEMYEGTTGLFSQEVLRDPGGSFLDLYNLSTQAFSGVTSWSANTVKAGDTLLKDSIQEFKDLTAQANILPTPPVDPSPSEIFAMTTGDPSASLLKGSMTSTEADKTKAPELVDPFDTWFSIFSLKALLGTLTSSLSSVVGGVNTILKDSANVLQSVGAVEQIVSPFENVLNHAIVATDTVAASQSSMIDKARALLDRGVTQIELPSYGALLIPPIKGGTEALRLSMQEMIKKSPDRPAQLNSKHVVIFPLLVVVSSDITGVANTTWTAVSELLKKVEDPVH